MSAAIIDMLTEKCDRLTAEVAELKQERRNLNDALTAAMDAAHQRAQERVKMEAQVNDWIRAAMHATMPHEFGIAFDPTSPMAWAESRRHALDMLLTERDALKAQLATARAEALREAVARIREIEKLHKGGRDGSLAAVQEARNAVCALLDGGTA